MPKIKLSDEHRSEWETLQDRRQWIEAFFRVNPTAGTANQNREQLAAELRTIKTRLNQLAVLGLTF
jgi:hypothetical protein